MCIFLIPRENTYIISESARRGGGGGGVGAHKRDRETTKKNKKLSRFGPRLPQQPSKYRLVIGGDKIKKDKVKNIMETKVCSSCL